MKMKRIWLSWYQKTEDERPLKFPPEGVLGYWNTGQRLSDGAWTLCALVESASIMDAKKIIEKNWPEAAWRFGKIVDSNLKPGDRFPKSKWMKF